ncbi:Ger(x)C family spore germination protein [Bacillus sp. S/N-304-OC-R1]|uniref:Ger(x)C family spore germination protein n=1 Tax=Bacillus sp. S/N-304-OC-R1 TaxID=2758034 RepID=UPI001C8EBE86|nr:Ger(x)C family spore germination protein [Bacillus sp. S/N-304-OC-R1]MBY0120471.1 Ger(x)C family spore germination protein [Bacillus sp. S/N-304-OC-R1]
MIRKSMTICTICLTVLFTTGCWDRKELNERGLWLATGWDVGKNGNIQLSGQIVVPSNMQSQSGSTSGANAFFTISSEGINVNDSTQNLQAKLSRESFPGHRRVVFFGEEFAKRGLTNKLDANTRGSDVSLRTDVFVVKGATAIEVLDLNDPLEKPPAVAGIKGHQEYGGRGDIAFVNFLIAASSDGTRPSLPVIEITKIQTGKSSEGITSEKIMRIGGLAVFNKELKLVGYLNNMENRAFLWIKGLLKKLTLTVKYDDGNASMIFTKIKSDIVPEVSSDNKIKITVKLSGKGAILENNTNLDLNDPKNVDKLKKAFEKESKKIVYKTIKKVQGKYGQDIFGFGDVVHKKYPQKWSSLRKDWDMHFSKADIVVTSNLQIRRVGMTGPSILQKESEINK